MLGDNFYPLGTKLTFTELINVSVEEKTSLDRYFFLMYKYPFFSTGCRLRIDGRPLQSRTRVDGETEEK